MILIVSTRSVSSQERYVEIWQLFRREAWQGPAGIINERHPLEFKA